MMNAGLMAHVEGTHRFEDQELCYWVKGYSFHF